jgi:hypothetical protein
MKFGRFMAKAVSDFIIVTDYNRPKGDPWEIGYARGFLLTRQWETFPGSMGMLAKIAHVIPLWRTNIHE